jgi:hypothetical protein
MVDQFEQLEVKDHPFFQRLAGGPVDMGAVWLLMANLREGISRDFVTCLAVTVARVADRRIGSLVAKQLDDELGHGDISRIHSLLLDRFVGALERWRTVAPDTDVLAPGRTLAERSVKPFYAEDPYEGVGALISGEIFARKMDFALGDQIRRQSALTDEELIWLTIHEKLEIDHADDSGTLAELLPTQGPSLSAAWRGAASQWQCLWSFLDEVEAQFGVTTPSGGRA